uniref:Uncharacterized protein n=1 Tax=Oryza rufipogon TaxID=4529 RepID=A0A0E0PC56_ORYRU
MKTIHGGSGGGGGGGGGGVWGEEGISTRCWVLCGSTSNEKEWATTIGVGCSRPSVRCGHVVVGVLPRHSAGGGGRGGQPQWLVYYNKRERFRMDLEALATLQLINGRGTRKKMGCGGGRLYVGLTY